MPSEARPTAPPPNSPKLGGFTAEIFFERRPPEGVSGRMVGVPKIRSLYEATYFAGLRKAGMPEE
jgi:hypothetical protein